MFDKSYHDSTNNEKSSHLIIVFNVHSMLRDIECEIGMSLHILYYGFVKVPSYMFICQNDNVRFTYYIHVYYFQI